MSEWYPIATAPIDGTWIQADIPGNGKYNIIAWVDGYLDSNGNDCFGWTFMTDQEHPPCWTDGVCWGLNEDNEQSVLPVAWKPLVLQRNDRGD